MPDIKFQPDELDTAAVRKVTDDYAAGWKQRDAQGLASLWVPEGTFRLVSGEFAEGRAELESIHATQFNGPLKDLDLAASVDTVDFLAPDLAVSEGILRFSNKNLPTPQEIEGNFMTVLEKRDGTWQIRKKQTMIPAAPLLAPPTD